MDFVLGQPNFSENTIPTSGAAVQRVAVAQPDFASGAAGCGASGLNTPEASRSGGSPEWKLIVTNSASNRVLIWNAVTNNNSVLIWNSFPTANFQPADVILGQGISSMALPTTTTRMKRLNQAPPRES
jgi:hypothetical protein